MNTSTARMLDANINRACEGLRLLEDYARFVLNDAALCQAVKQDRHAIASLRKTLLADDELLSRDTPGDVGTTVKTESEINRPDMAAVLQSAGSRATEAMRVIGEIAKLHHPAIAGQVEAIRYRTYSTTQFLRVAETQRGRFDHVVLCVLITESLCLLPWQTVVEDILRPSPWSGKVCLQLREKQLPDAQLLARAKWLGAACRASGAVCIINDRLDIALAADAAGVHLGQEDLPCAVARKIAGTNFFIGISTQTLDEAHRAVQVGATYIGIGPMFPSTTKVKSRIAGTAFASEISAANLPAPAVAIGGITLENLHAIRQCGIQRIAVSAAVIQSEHPGDVCSQLVDQLLKAAEQPKSIPR